jgi:hypothetical protein
MGENCLQTVRFMRPRGGSELAQVPPRGPMSSARGSGAARRPAGGPGQALTERRHERQLHPHTARRPAKGHIDAVNNLGGWLATARTYGFVLDSTEPCSAPDLTAAIPRSYQPALCPRVSPRPDRT